MKNIYDKFVFGTQIYRFPSLPLQELKQDIHTIKDLGFNSVKIQISWCIVEKIKGEINLTEIEELIIEAQRVEMGVCLLITLEQIPMWVWRKYPDCRLLNAKNEPHEDPTQYLLPADGKPGPCWDHPGVRQEAEQFLSLVAQRLSKYKNITAWNVWQEIGFWEDQGIKNLPEKTYCYCPYTLKRFREWVKQKYKNLQDLNNLWKTGFGNWEEVEPPRRFMMVPSWIDWQYFMNIIYLSGILKWRRETLQKNDPLQRQVMAHVDIPTFGSERDGEYAKETDIFGTSFYPSWISFSANDSSCSKIKNQSKDKILHYELSRFSMHFDYIRSAVRKEKEFYLGEFQGGPFSYGIYITPDPTPEDIKRWILIALSSGVQGIYFWNHRPDIFWREMHGFGLCNWDGSPTERAREAGHISKAINRHSSLFKQGYFPPPQTAIVVNEDLYSFVKVTPYALKCLQYSLTGWYQFLWHEGIWVDFIGADQVLHGNLKNYKVVILPFPIALGNELTEALKSYVSAGGMLISEACPGRVDKYGLANLPGLAKAMRELFGVEHANLHFCQEWNDIESTLDKNNNKIPSISSVGRGVYQSYTMKANLYMETYKLTHGTPILSCTKGITGVINNYGKGKGILLGTLVGHTLLPLSNTKTKCFILKLIKDLEIKPELCGKFLRRRRVYNEKEAWFLVNDSNKQVTESIDVANFIRVEDILKNKTLDIKNNKIAITIKPFRIHCLVMSK
jgi:beta-galactosidase GanA